MDEHQQKQQQQGLNNHLQQQQQQQQHQKTKLVEINSYLTCYLCKGYLIDATTISECLHSFCRSCIIKFLQENCYCPVCEVIINKAKPCLKLDKTLQDIVYKLVPELFVSEMIRRKSFYKDRPALAPKVSPEARGEDTERTIFNPKDLFSISLEHISDDKTPGAISIIPNASSDEKLMKRYLQCPGMCRIEVLKKFVCGKYNVDTALFHIDILYKRVPLPDHYTLIDIGYIYSWKRNEPMKFFFRITDINKVSERFDYFDGRAPASPVVITEVVKTPKAAPAVKVAKEKVASSRKMSKAMHAKARREKLAAAKTPPPLPATPPPPAPLPPPKTPDLDLKTPSKNNNVYTNITLNRDDNVEIITKIQKVSNKAGQPISLNIINVKKSSGGPDRKSDGTNGIKEAVTKDQSVCNNNINNGNSGSSAKSKEVVDRSLPKNCTPMRNMAELKRFLAHEKEDAAKSSFLKLIGLIPNTSDLRLPPPKGASTPKPSGSAMTTTTTNSKRKSASPLKNESKRVKASQENNNPKKPVKIIIQPKGIQNPTVRQMVSNVNQNANDVSKIMTSKDKSTDLQSLINNCKINIPSSLSITLNGEGNTRTPPMIPPVKNYIEILKLPEGGNGGEKGKKPTEEKQFSFQKMFEQSIKKEEKKSPLPKESPDEKKVAIPRLTKPTSPPFRSPPPKTPPVLSPPFNSSQLLCNNSNPLPKTSPISKATPASSPLRRSTPPPLMTSASMHSSSLGLNYTVSVASSKTPQPPPPTPPPPKIKPSTSKPPPAARTTNNHHSNQNQILAEKFKIQNLAQFTANFNFNHHHHHPSNMVLQQAMLKHIESQNWVNRSCPGPPLLNYEKYLQSLSANQGKVLGNIKEN